MNVGIYYTVHLGQPDESLRLVCDRDINIEIEKQCHCQWPDAACQIMDYLFIEGVGRICHLLGLQHLWTALELLHSNNFLGGDVTHSIHLSKGPLTYLFRLCARVVTDISEAYSDSIMFGS